MSGIEQHRAKNPVSTEVGAEWEWWWWEGFKHVLRGHLLPRSWHGRIGGRPGNTGEAALRLGSSARVLGLAVALAAGIARFGTGTLQHARLISACGAWWDVGRAAVSQGTTVRMAARMTAVFECMRVPMAWMRSLTRTQPRFSSKIEKHRWPTNTAVWLAHQCAMAFVHTVKVFHTQESILRCRVLGASCPWTLQTY